MKALIFGSTAAKHFFSDFPREPADLDIMSEDGKMSRQEQSYWWPVFAEIAENNKDPEYCDPESLYAIKCAHSKWDIHWAKTMSDILFFQKKGVKLNKELYRKLVKDFAVTHGKRWAKLEGKDSTTFFQDAVKRKYNHDDLHEVVAYYDRPLYERILKNPETKSVVCCKDKFADLPQIDKIRLVKEEVFVTALERYLVPSNFTSGDNLAYARSLKKLMTTMSGGGWFAEFMVENYSSLYRNTDWEFIKRFREKYNE